MIGVIVLRYIKTLFEVWYTTYFDPDKQLFNSSSPGQNDCLFTDDIFRMHFCEWNFLIKISLKFVPKGPIDNEPTLVQIMAWHGIGDKPLPEPMLTQFTDA